MRTILVETASRFARDLIVQETGYEMLKARGIELIVASRVARCEQLCRNKLMTPGNPQQNILARREALLDHPALHLDAEPSPPARVDNLQAIEMLVV